MKLLALCALAACGGATPAPAPPPRTAEDAPALDALKSARFADAVKLSADQLKLAPRDSEAAAIHAFASYINATGGMFVALNLRHSWFPILDVLEPKNQPALTAFLGQLDAVDADLAVAANDATFSLELCMACWQYDFNHDGNVDAHDALFTLDGFPPDDPRAKPTFHFDIGDVSWARAMISFQRAAAELILAYRWSDAEGEHTDQPEVVIHLIAPERVKHARELILAGLEFSDTSRKQYLAETDDDREWVPNPNQKSHPIPLDVDQRLYATWQGVLGDVRQLVEGRQGVSIKQIAIAIDPRVGAMAPDAYVNLGRMLSEPTDIKVESKENGRDLASVTKILRGLLGHGYSEHMPASPLVGRLVGIKGELEAGSDTLEKKLHYLIWIN